MSITAPVLAPPMAPRPRSRCTPGPVQRCGRTLNSVSIEQADDGIATIRHLAASRLDALLAQPQDETVPQETNPVTVLALCATVADLRHDNEKIRSEIEDYATELRASADPVQIAVADVLAAIIAPRKPALAEDPARQGEPRPGAHRR